MPKDKTVVVQPFTSPAEIEARSFAVIDAEVPEPRPFSGLEWEIVRRMIHTTADFELLNLARIHPKAVENGLNALRSGCAVVTDTEMARKGMPVRRLDPLGCRALCWMNDPEVAARAKAGGITRARAAMDKAAELAGPVVVVIGNAPTALLRLLELVKEGKFQPALVAGMPVGFVNAAESKDLLLAEPAIPSITIKGRKGGSALAACVVNALAEIALRA